MSDADGVADATTARLETLVAEERGAGGTWTVDAGAGEVTVALPDRDVVVRRRPGPDSDPRWTVVLRSGGETVSKFGPFASAAERDERVRSLLDTEVRYTVCCDG